MRRITQLRRDPYARATLMRQCISREHLTKEAGCTECGGRNGHGGLFLYWWESDGTMRHFTPSKGFCCESCWQSYWMGE